MSRVPVTSLDDQELAMRPYNGLVKTFSLPWFTEGLTVHSTGVRERLRPQSPANCRVECTQRGLAWTMLYAK